MSIRSRGVRHPLEAPMLHVRCTPLSANRGNWKLTLGLANAHVARVSLYTPQYRGATHQ